MKIALLQFDTLWENKESNLANVADKMQTLANDIDLVVLPEMFTTGFSMTPNLIAEIENDHTLKTLQNLAIKQQLAITGSWITKEDDLFYNRLYFVFPDGSYQTYNKRHLFTLAGEEKVYTAGNEKLIVSYKGWNICPLVCYDLRFPVYSRIEKENYDLLIYVASWPDRRIFAWDSLLKARAIENMSYVVAVNRCGTDPNDVYYSGHSQAIDFMGAYIQEPFLNEEIKIVEIDKESLEKARAKFAFLNDADEFELKK
ncbi:nitrilase family protein [Flavobacterium sp. xlx-214]|uniref:nitrilase family protein n=1 Tax=unclassified Flavobacterium TaxID=196869 RepID=UPI0013D24B5F|nr:MULTISPECIES: nitrilase family protein [unclassified Flavobacterium]MBA5793047.1 nitrilase family protein [Flavobacterium sp. xlx-221]QMI84625.1 nitrilase family protein [Flavobacterium sp. xlx-214]